jgi:DNA-binding NarL/FixJ family response regulator
MPATESDPPRRGTVLPRREEQNVRTLLGKYLAEQGYADARGANSDEPSSVQGHKDSAISLMICDLVMTEMNGIELARGPGPTTRT